MLFTVKIMHSSKQKYIFNYHNKKQPFCEKSQDGYFITLLLFYGKII